MYLTDQNAADWADYWEVTPENRSIYLDIPGEISGCLAFLDDQEEAHSAEADTDDAGAGSAADHAMSEESVAEMIEGTDIYIAKSAEEVLEADRIGGNGKEILLEVGIRAGFDEADNSVWILKAGCREFFEMMQF